MLVVLFNEKKYTHKKFRFAVMKMSRLWLCAAATALDYSGMQSTEKQNKVVLQEMEKWKLLLLSGRKKWKNLCINRE